MKVMEKRELSTKQKRLIFILGICVIFLGVALLSYIDPDNKGNELGMAITVVPILLGLAEAFLIQDKTRTVKIIVFCLGTALILSSWWLLSLTDVGKVLGLYVGGFWAGTKWSKNSFISDILEDKKDGSSSEAKKD